MKNYLRRDLPQIGKAFDAVTGEEGTRETFYWGSEWECEGEKIIVNMAYWIWGRALGIRLGMKLKKQIFKIVRSGTLKISSEANRQTYGQTDKHTH